MNKKMLGVALAIVAVVGGIAATSIDNVNFEADDLQFDGQTLATGDVTRNISLIQNGSRVEIFANGVRLGRTNGAGDDGAGSGVLVYKNQTWDNKVPFAFGTYSSYHTGTVPAVWTPRFNGGSVKLMNIAKFKVLAPNATSIDLGNGLTVSQEGARVFFRQNGSNIGRTNGAGDDATLIAAGVISVRTSSELLDPNGTTVDNGYANVPLALVRYRNTFRLYTPRLNGGSVKLIDSIGIVGTAN